jgi:hypothetical protein
MKTTQIHNRFSFPGRDEKGMKILRELREEKMSKMSFNVVNFRRESQPI